MKLTVLMENTTCNDALCAEHGLSLYLETAQHNILFDAGKTAAFAENAKAMGIDLQSVDIAILSHGHYDHGGGLACFLAQNDHAPVYISQHAFSPCYHGNERYIGLDPALQGNSRLIAVHDDLQIDATLSISSCNGLPCVQAVDSAGLCVQQGVEYLPEQFLHEQYLTIREDGRNILISGCSHKGILNIMAWHKPDVLVGGFHFMNVDVSTGESALLDAAAVQLSNYHTKYYTCHCTGQPQYEYLKQKMGNQLHYLATGQVCML
ncbi:MAG: MBL fold metallo-hydrolase [Faecalibacterium sp.]